MFWYKKIIIYILNVLEQKITNCDYCKMCSNQAKKTENKKPIYGDIRDRKEQWSEELLWKPKGYSKEVAFIEVVEKLQIDINKVKKEVKKLNGEIFLNVI